MYVERVTMEEAGHNSRPVSCHVDVVKAGDGMEGAHTTAHVPRTHSKEPESAQ